ncbi:MAG: cytidine deaminase family protein [Anaerolineae bacterium]
MNNAELIAAAKAVVGDRKLSEDCSAGSVAAALITEAGNVYVGVCIDAACGIGFCAEHTAIAQMVTRGESRIVKIVALAEDGTFLPPCGRCRELMYQVDNGNLESKILLGPHRITQLSDLLPMRWQDA